MQPRSANQTGNLTLVIGQNRRCHLQLFQPARRGDQWPFLDSGKQGGREHLASAGLQAGGQAKPGQVRPSQATQIAFHYPVPRSAHPNPSHPYIPDLKKIVFIAPQDPFVLKRFQGTGQLVSRLSGQVRLTGLFCAF